MQKSKHWELIGDFSQLWKLKDKSEKIPMEELRGYMDPASIIMVIPKVEGVKEIIESHFDVGPPIIVPPLSYSVQILPGTQTGLEVFARIIGEKSKYEENAIRLGAGYLKIVLTLCSKTASDSILFKFRKDYPLWAETEEMIVILAPKVEQ